MLTFNIPPMNDGDDDDGDTYHHEFNEALTALLSGQPVPDHVTNGQAIDGAQDVYQFFLDNTPDEFSDDELALFPAYIHVDSRRNIMDRVLRVMVSVYAFRHNGEIILVPVTQCNMHIDEDRSGFLAQLYDDAIRRVEQEKRRGLRVSLSGA